MELTPSEIAIGLFLLGHLGTAVWVGATVKNDVKHMQRTVVELASDVKQLARAAASMQPVLREYDRRISALEEHSP